MIHAIKLTEEFRMLDNSVPKKFQEKSKNGRTSRGANSNGTTSPISFSGVPSKEDKNLPICLYPLHKAKCYCHLLRDCTACADHKKSSSKAHADELARTGPPRSTRSQATPANNISDKFTPAKVLNVSGHLRPSAGPNGFSFFFVKISDG